MPDTWIEALFFRPHRTALAFPVIVIVVFLILRMRTLEPMPLIFVAPAGLVLSVGWIVAVHFRSPEWMAACLAAFVLYLAGLIYLQTRA